MMQGSVGRVWKSTVDSVVTINWRP